MATGPKYVSVRTKEGTPKFRRGGQSFTREATILSSDAVSEEDLKAIREDELLEVEDISEAEAIKRGMVTDGRLPLEKAFGDYPPPGGPSSGVIEPPENPARKAAGSNAPPPATPPVRQTAARAPTKPDEPAADDETAKRGRR